MQAPECPKLRLAELVSALSYAMNLTASLVPGHCVRASFIAISIGEKLGFDDEALTDLYYMVLLKDVGCSANASRVAEVFMADDIALKRDLKETNTALKDRLRIITTHVARGESQVTRIGRLAMILARKGAFLKEFYDTRCQQGARIVEMLRFSEDVKNGILDLNEHWDGTGQPAQKSGQSITSFSRIALLAQVADVFFVAHGRERAKAEVAARSGGMLDPDLVRIFDDVASDEFWAALDDPDLARKLTEGRESTAFHPVDDCYLDEIINAFALVIDSKSPYTSGHSNRVAQLARQIGRHLGHDDEAQKQLWRAGLLHDIGKLGVSSLILNKPGSLGEEEFVAVRKHAKMGEDLLSRVDVLKPLAKIVGGHHEFLDGTGYPRGLVGTQISDMTRILTVADIFDALTSKRPYRAAMPVAQALNVMEVEMGTALDKDCFATLKSLLNGNERFSPVAS